jgi:ABC-2 type transport system permease protein
MQKEFRSLRRIPRFRVIFGMACLFGTILFTQIMRQEVTGLGVDNFLPLVNVYGFLLLGEVLLWNVFGFDRWATQLYYLAPVNFRAVLLAKNLVAVFFMLCQTVLVFMVVALLRFEVTPQSVLNEFAVSAVVAIFFLAAGNMASVLLPKRVDGNQTFRKQASGTVQVWMLLSSFAICLLLSFAFLARYALQTNWAFLSVLAVEFGIGVIVYRIAMESAVEHAGRGSERLLEALSGNASPLSS